MKYLIKYGLYTLTFGLSILFLSNNKKENFNYKKYHKLALNYCNFNKMSTSYYFLIDFDIHSGKNRFFVYDFKKDSIIMKSLVTHGSCDQFGINITQLQKAKFDKRIDSHCSMKGKYKVEGREYSSWGINVKYWLKGLEPQNETAEERIVVLHSWNKVANKEIYPVFSPLSWGCPAVSDAFMKKLDELLKNENKPVLMWIIGD